MRSPFKISITVFLWLASSLLMLVFLVISIGALNSIGEIARLSSAVRQKNLPEILENQRSFINLESLRRIAEVDALHERAPFAGRHDSAFAESLILSCYNRELAART